jgi:Cu/Ag efflux pump CusA
VTLATVAGLLAVLAVFLRQSLSLLGRFRDLRAAGMRFGPDLVARGARERLAPTVTPALATAAVLAPAVAFGAVAGQEIVRPAAVVVLGGLVASTLVSLFVLPALYLRFGPRHEPELLRLDPEPDATERELVHMMSDTVDAGRRIRWSEQRTADEPPP